MVKSCHLRRLSCKRQARLGSLAPHKQLPWQLPDHPFHLQAEQGHRDRRGRQAAAADHVVDADLLGKDCLSPGRLKGNWVISAPLAAICSKSLAFSGGVTKLIVYARHIEELG